MIPVNLVVEGSLDATVMQRVLNSVGLPCGGVYIKVGKPNVLKALPGYNQAARFLPWCVVVDLDQQPDCAPELVYDMLPEPASGIRFRIAVRAIESWLLADAERLADFLHVPVTKFPSNPEEEADPKRTIVDLVRSHSTRERIREAIVPRPGSGASIGPGYVALLEEFIKQSQMNWRPDVAIQHSDSLRRCVAALETLKEWTPET